MNFGICLIGFAPLRKEPTHRAEMVTQVIFGECMQIVQRKGDWLKVETLDDHYPGWIHHTQITALAADDFEQIMNQKRFISISPLSNVMEERTGQDGIPAEVQQQAISGGSSFYSYDGKTMSISGRKFSITGELMEVKTTNKAAIPGFAKGFLSTPYLWGGRSVYGFDCSGFVQLVLKMAGIQITRDAATQAGEGEQVHLLQETLPGDLVFFDNDEEIITHVGILLSDLQVIHAYGKVRIDPIDQQGIFNSEHKRYSHRLRLIKRLMPEG